MTDDFDDASTAFLGAIAAQLKGMSHNEINAMVSQAFKPDAKAAAAEALRDYLGASKIISTPAAVTEPTAGPELHSGNAIPPEEHGTAKERAAAALRQIRPGSD